MADPPATISVFIQFPTRTLGAVAYLSPTTWKWYECLVIPVDELQSLGFSLKPYKWIRYAAGAVSGTHGDLSLERDSFSATPIDYNDINLPTVSLSLYYHVTDKEKLRMFPVDPNLAKTRMVTSSATNTRRDEFRDDVERRDRRCLFTGLAPRYCHAAHIIAYSKGDEVQLFCSDLDAQTLII
jgi:hypothetical protein